MDFTEKDIKIVSSDNNGIPIVIEVKKNVKELYMPIYNGRAMYKRIKFKNSINTMALYETCGDMPDIGRGKKFKIKEIEPFSKKCSVVQFGILLSNKIIEMVANGDKKAIKATILILRKSIDKNSLIFKAKQYCKKE